MKAIQQRDRSFWGRPGPADRGWVELRQQNTRAAMVTLLLTAPCVAVGLYLMRRGGQQ